MAAVKGYLAEILKRKHASIKENISEIEERLGKLAKPMDELQPLADLELDELRQKLQENEITVPDLLHAFQAKAVKLYHEGNSGICEFIKEAEVQANDLAKSWDSRDDKAPLCGIPISIKELCSCEGYDSTFGLIKLCEKPAKHDAILVKALKAEGAIPFVLTACSQLAFSMSGDNIIFGNMHSPHSVEYAQGGSSAGEAVLLAKHGSPVGIGSDLAGSIRIPSALCGLSGLKPCSERISMKGQADLAKDMLVALKICLGPMGRKVDHLAQVMRTLLRPSMFQLDVTIPPIPFREDVYSGQSKPVLKIGYYSRFSDSLLIKPVPAVQKAVERAITILKSKGHEIVEFDPPSPRHALEISLQCLTGDGGKLCLDATRDEPLCDQCKGIQMLVRVPDALRGAVDAITRHRIGEPASMAKMVTRSRTAESTIKLINKVDEYRDKFHEAWEKVGDMDAIVCPVWAYPAIPNKIPVWYVSPPIIFTVLYNLVDYPAGSVPMGAVSEQDVKDALEEAEKFKKANDLYHQKLFEMQKGTEELPVAVQVVGKPFQEEVVLRVMREIEEGSN
ncbi:unnamed protein product [Calicophoron daubneyi]|uniref:Amidase domain-containing protein n=1 Tax=Calicophoron daubneyi TaxID=300641 RepID=A0AAV2TL98_CALDB